MINKKIVTITAAISILGAGIAAVPVFAAGKDTSASASTAQQAGNEKQTKHGHFNRGNAGKELIQQVSAITGIDQATILKDLKAGQSLAEIAASKGVSEQTLVQDLQDKLKTKLDQQVANGKLTADRESKMLTIAAARITKEVEHKGVLKKARRKDHPELKQVSSVLGIDEKTLTQELKSGKTLADIASSKGMSQDTLVNSLVNQLKTQLDQKVDAGKLTADKETQVLSKAQTRFSQMVTKKWFHKQENSSKSSDSSNSSSQSNSTSQTE